MKMETAYDKEIKLYIEKWGFSKFVNINEQTEDVVIQIEENFIMGFSGIDWEQNEIIYSQKLDSDPEKYLNEAKIFLDKICISFPNLLDERVIVVGDNLTSLSYDMKFEYFLYLFDQFLSIPQHFYCWFPVSKKCINFSFENEVYFG